jgi:hypothetical protein
VTSNHPKRPTYHEGAVPRRKGNTMVVDSGRNGGDRCEKPSSPSDAPVLPDITTTDERSVGWGDDPEEQERDGEWYRRERPPHHE